MCQKTNILLFLLFFIFKNLNSVPVQEGVDRVMKLNLKLSLLDPSEVTGERVANWHPLHPTNPEELGDYLEGDIFSSDSLRNGLAAMDYRWPKGEVYYEISGNFSTNDTKQLHKAFEMYHKYTCINFRPKKPEDGNYIFIENERKGCFSSVGRTGGEQVVNFQTPSCLVRVGTVVHELMHAIGFMHEQCRYERDKYIDIKWENIREGAINNFDKDTKNETIGFGVGYDYNSIMHYSPYSFSKNHNATILPKMDGDAKNMGQRQGFSIGDITKINNMYNCSSKTDEVLKKYLDSDNRNLDVQTHIFA